MQSSVRAVEAYRRSRLIDGVTIDEDKIAPVYRLEEICQLLRSSPLDIVREMLEYTLKRLDHKSPIVKQKTLRFIKYASAKAGPEFKREMQRHAGVVRSLFHYKGHPDALKGDALNKAVRDMAHETIAAIFGTEERPTTMEDVGKRIQGFGSSNYEKPREEEKKSVLSGLVGFGSQSIRQSLDMINNYNHYSGSGSGSNRSSFAGTYRSQGLRRSLTAERERSFDKDDGGEHWSVRDVEADDFRSPSSPTENSTSKPSFSNGRGGHSDGKGVTVEDRLLSSLTTPGGVRLQPTRETLQAFTTTAQKLDAACLVNSFETKLKAHSWQVRFKALCLLEASIRERENKVLDSVTMMFEEDATAVADCLQSPQTSLRDKARKVLDMLGGGVKDTHAEQGTELDNSSVIHQPADLPDLLDTTDLDFDSGQEYMLKGSSVASELEIPVSATSDVTAPGEVDLFGDWLREPSANVPSKDTGGDPFAGMSVHSSDNAVGNGMEPDLFSGLDVDSSRTGEHGAVEGSGGHDSSILFDSLSFLETGNTAAPQDNLMNLMESLSTSTGSSATPNSLLEQVQSISNSSRPGQQPITAMPVTANLNFGSSGAQFFHPQPPGMPVPGGVSLGTGVKPQMFVFPSAGVQFVNGYPTGIPGPIQANVMMQQQAFTPGAMNYPGMNAAFGQQQFTGGFTGVPRYGGALQTNHVNGGVVSQNYPGSFDFSGDPSSRYMENTKKEDTKAFDFITDHVSSQLGATKKSR